MSTIAGYLFIFMLISSLLGFLLSWAWKQSTINTMTKDLAIAQKDANAFQKRLDNLQEHTQKLEKEKEKLVYENERLSFKLNTLLNRPEGLNQQESSNSNEDQTYIDTSSLDEKIRSLNAQITKLNDEIDVAKKESLEWQVQYSEILKEKEELNLQLQALRNPKT